MNTLVPLFSLLLALALSASSFADDVQPPVVDPITADQILLVSSRGYASVIGRTLDFSTTRAHELNANGHLIPNAISLEAPLNLDQRETWFFVHGNQIPAREAIRRGTRIYRRLRSCACCEGPIRFVIWSWPSERDSGRIRDAKEKAIRTDVESFLLGSLLARLTQEAPVSIIGYSFGSRVVSGALHLASGGRLCGYQLTETITSSIPLRVVYIAAAVENNAFHHCGRYSQGLSKVESLYLLNNSRDPALGFFWILDKSHPKAMGDTGIRGFPQHCQVKQWDWAKSVGREHSIWEYVERPNALHQITTGIDR